MKSSSVKLILAGLMFLGVFPLPYGYYTFLRIVAAIVFGVNAIIYFDEKKVLAIVYGLLTILFQPLIPITMNKESWIVIDIIVAIFLLIMWWVERKDD